MFRRLASVAQRTLTRALHETTAAGEASVSYALSADGTYVDVLGIFQDAHAEADLDTTSGVSTVEPVCSFQVADLSALGAYPPLPTHRVRIKRAQGAPEDVGEQIFAVADHLPDGEGMVQLVLTKA